jgi:hypothetical protein
VNSVVSINVCTMKRIVPIVIAFFALCSWHSATAFAQESTADSANTFVHFFSLPIDPTVAEPGPMREIRDTSDIVYIDYAYGKGAPLSPGKRHFIRFIGCRRNGDIFDTTYSGTKLFSFVLGNNELLKGLEMGMRDMKCGARRQVFIPGRLAYGENGFPSVGIGKNEMLIFYVELVKVE